MRFGMWGMLALVVFVMTVGQGCKPISLKELDRMEFDLAELKRLNARQEKHIASLLDDNQDIAKERDQLRGNLDEKDQLLAASQEIVGSLNKVINDIREAKKAGWRSGSLLPSSSAIGLSSSVYRTISASESI